MTLRGLSVALLTLALGCGPVVLGGEESGSGVTTLEGSSDSGDASTTSAAPPPTTASTDSPVPPQPPRPGTGTTSGSTGDGEPPVNPCACNLLCPACPAEGCPGYDPECGMFITCDIWDQDCPDGEKCMPWANDGGFAWNATKCTPVDPKADQVGDACTVLGTGQSGVDSCDISQLCFDTDPDNNGTCVGFCGGTADDPVCPEGQACSISNLGTLALCLPTCDPLLPGCAEGDGCFPTAEADAFVCLPAPSPSIDLPWTCHTTGGCNPGSLCVEAFNLPECEDEMCCTPYCDLGSPSCPGDTECLAFWEKGQAPPDLENLGACVVLLP